MIDGHCHVTLCAVSCDLMVCAAAADVKKTPAPSSKAKPDAKEKKSGKEGKGGRSSKEGKEVSFTVTPSFVCNVLTCFWNLSKYTNSLSFYWNYL